MPPPVAAMTVMALYKAALPVIGRQAHANRRANEVFKKLAFPECHLASIILLKQIECPVWDSASTILPKQQYASPRMPTVLNHPSKFVRAS